MLSTLFFLPNMEENEEAKLEPKPKRNIPPKPPIVGIMLGGDGSDWNLGKLYLFCKKHISNNVKNDLGDPMPLLKGIINSSNLNLLEKEIVTYASEGYYKSLLYE